MIYRNAILLLDNRRLKQINKRKAKKLFSQGKEIFVNPCKLSLHTQWSSYFGFDHKDIEGNDFENFINSVSYYNCNSESGSYLHYFTDESNI